MAMLLDLLEDCFQCRDILFFRIMEFSVYGTIWLVLLFLIGYLTGKKSDVLWQYPVSVCIALHLLFPVHIQWFSVEIPFLQEMGQEIEIAGDKIVKEPFSKAENMSFHRMEPAVSETSYSRVRKSALKEENGQEISFSKKQNDTKKRKRSNSLKTIAEFVWILGMLLFFGKTGLSYLVFSRQVKRRSRPASSLSVQILQQVREQYGIRRNIRLWRSNKVSSPMLYGVFKTVILLPNQEYNSREYQYIFRHELSHYRHRDVWMKYLFTICKGVYWFHPLVHWMYFNACLQMEILCDEAVVGGKDISEKRAYSMVLLRHISASSGKIPLSAGFYGGKKYMKMRFKNIMSTTKRKVGFGFVFTVAFFAIIFGGVKWNVSAETEQENGITKESRKGNDLSEKEKISDQTIAVIGVDEKNFADAIFLLRVHAEAKEISIEDIPRDLLIEADDFSAVLAEEQKKNEKMADIVSGEKKAQKLSWISAVYNYEILLKALEKIYDVTIDSHIVLDDAMVSGIIDTVGGVKVTLTKKEAAYLNHTNFISQKENRTVKAGKQTLNGDQAMGYIRVRKLDGGAVINGKESGRRDIFGRSDRCNNVLLGLAERVRDQKVNWRKLAQLVVQKNGIQETEIPPDELVSLAKTVVTEDFTVVVSKERTDEDYAAEFNPNIGNYLRLKK